jgi:DNA-binding IclR family transcriptional regulator
MRAKDLAEALGIKWTTAYRTIAYLHDNGFLERDDATGLYYIGARLYYIGSSYVNHLPVLQASGAHLQEAAERAGATVQLVQRYGARSVVLAVAEPTGVSHIPKTTIGWHFPLHCGAKGQVLLAYSDQGFIDEYLEAPLQGLTPYTVTDPDELRAQLERIRASGYAISQRDVQLSTGAVAFPIANSSGEVVASLTLIVDHTELEERETALVDVASVAGERISMGLGWRPETGWVGGREAVTSARRGGPAR